MSEIGGIAKLLAHEGNKNQSLAFKVRSLIDQRDACKSEVEQWKSEIASLKDALRAARNAARERGIGFEQFAAECQISEVQLAAWTVDATGSDREFDEWQGIE